MKRWLWLLFNRLGWAKITRDEVGNPMGWGVKRIDSFNAGPLWEGPALPNVPFRDGGIVDETFAARICE